jgi:hypothetical protein
MSERLNHSGMRCFLSGEDQPKGTMFQIFSTIIETIKEPVFTKIGFDWDLEKRRAAVEIAGVVQVRSEPIRNPVTDKEHRILQARLEGLPKAVRDIAWKAQIRLCARYRRLSGAGKKLPIVIAAVAREIAAFLWVIGRQVAPA